MDRMMAHPLAEDDRPSSSLQEPNGAFRITVSMFLPTPWPQTQEAHLSVHISPGKNKMTASNAVVRERLNTRPALALKANPL